MLRLLKSGRAKSRRQAADYLGYSVTQVNRWWEQYQQHGLVGLTSLKPHLGKQRRVDSKVWAALQEEVQAGRIRRLEDARLYLQQQWGITYSSPSGVWSLFKQHGMRLKPKRTPQEFLDTDEHAILIEN
jgi:transposase